MRQAKKNSDSFFAAKIIALIASSLLLFVGGYTLNSSYIGDVSQAQASEFTNGDASSNSENNREHNQNDVDNNSSSVQARSDELSASNSAAQLASSSGDSTSFVDPGYENYGIICPDNEMIQSGKSYDFLSNVTTIPTKTDTREGDEFSVVVSSVDNENGCSYTYKQGDASFIPSKNDDGKKYTVHYQLMYRGSSSGNAWIAVPNVQKTKILTVYTVNETINELDNDGAYIKSVSESGRIDGSGPWDGDDAPGDDSSDGNGIVRTYDTATWNIAYTTISHDIGTSYSNAWIKFEFVIPYDSTEVSFDTSAMSWMSTDKQHMWSISKTTLGGKTVQTLTCWKRLTSQGTSTSVVPGSGEVYLTLRAFSAKNGEIISPVTRVSLPGNAAVNTKCSTHGIYESKQLQLSDVTISAAPSYNLFWRSGGSSPELSSTFDFSTGTDDAPNKNAGKINGRCLRVVLCIELRNKEIQNGPDKGKDKKLKGIEMPVGDITYDVDLSTTYIVNKKKIDLSGISAYTPLIYDIAANGKDSLYNRDKQGMSSSGNAPTSIDNTIQKNGMSEQKKYTNYIWNSGKYRCTQSSNKVSVTIHNYEINPLWYPSADTWNSKDKTYYDWELGVLNTSRGVFSSSVMYIVVPYGNGDDYLPKKYNASGSISLKMSDSNLQATTASNQKLQKSDTNTNQSVTTDDELSLSAALSRSGTYSNTVMFSYKEKPNMWRGSEGLDDTYNTNHGSDQVALGDKVGVYFGTMNNANGESKNIMQARDMLLKFDDKALSVTDQDKKFGDGQMLYACKKDGSGWADDDEMQSTNIEDLFYYDNYDKLLADGKICVGILNSYRNPSSKSTGWDSRFTACLLQANSDQKMNGYVAQIVVESNAWHLYNESADGTLVKNAEVPTLIDVQNGKATFDEYHGDSQYIRNSKKKYIKAEYDAGGNFHEHTSGYSIGDSIRLVSYKANVEITTAQHDDAGNNKKIYDLDNNQYTVDYEIKPTAEMIDGINIDLKSTLLLKATIPAGMEYIPDSSYFGGKYIESDPIGYHGKNTGTAVAPTITKNSDGTSTIFWNVPNVDIKSKIPSLFFSCKIDSMTKRNSEFQTSVSIQTTEDKREASAYNHNYSTLSIKTAKTADISLKTSVRQPMNDMNSSLTWDLSWSNNGSNNLRDQLMLVKMPNNKDSEGSSYSGTYDITNIMIKDIIGKTTDYEIWYTTDEAGTNITTESDSGVTSTTVKTGKTGNISWKKATIEQSGKVSGIPANGVTALGIIGTLPSAGSINAEMTILPSNNDSGNRYVNTIWLTNSTTQASAYIVRRVISGCAWIDANGNGKRDSEELYLKGVKVTLVDATTGDTITNLDGNECTTTTSDGGTYRFDKLPAGNMKVVFTDAGAGFYKYRQSEAHVAGLDASVDDDAIGEYDDTRSLVRGTTEEILIPSTQDIVSTPYIIQNIDGGYIPQLNLPFSGGSGSKIADVYIGILCALVGMVAFALGTRWEYKIYKRKKSRATQ